MHNNIIIGILFIFSSSITLTSSAIPLYCLTKERHKKNDVAIIKRIKENISFFVSLGINHKSNMIEPRTTGKNI